MRICLVSRQFDPFTTGGIGTYIAQLSRAMVRAGHEVHVLTEPHRRLAREGGGLAPGVRFHAVDLRSGPASLDAYPMHAMKYSMAVYGALRGLCSKTGFDLVEFPDYQAEGYHSIRAKRTLGVLAGAVAAVRVHTPTRVMREADRQYFLDRDLAFLDHMELASICEAELLISPDRGILERLGAAAAPGIPRNTEQVRAWVPLPIDADAAEAELGATEAERSEGPTVLYYGRIQHLKGCHLLVEAGRRLLDEGVDVRFRFIGGDTETGPGGRSMLEHLRGRVDDRWRNRFSFEPARPRAALGAAIRAAEVCCFPSLWEIFGMACLEAMALGACVVASDAGGFRGIFEDGRSGVQFGAGDVDALTDALRRALADPELRRRTGEAARARVRALCDPAAVVGRYEELVLACRGGPAAAEGAPEPVRVGDGPAVSVVIPYYNMARYLPETLRSVRAQTFTDYEIVIINDGSTEEASVRLLDELAGEPGLRVVHKPNGGLGSARNRGLREARGRWAMLLDADDLIAPEYLDKTIALMRRYPGLAVASCLCDYFIDDPAEPTGGWCPLGLDRDLLGVWNVGAIASSLLDRRIALDAGGYDEWLPSFEDWDFWCSLAERGHVAAIIPEFLFHYRVRPESMFRTIAASRQHELKCYLVRRHPGLALDRERVMRMHASEAPPPDGVEARARAIVGENLRYRIADRVNSALKRLRMQQALKGLAARAIRGRRG